MEKTNKSDYKVGIIIKIARKQADLTLRMLSQKASISPSNLSRIEKGTIEPSQQVIDKLLKVLNTSINHDHKKNTWFDQKTKRFYNLLMYMKYNEARTIYFEIIKEEAYLKTSSRILEYYFFRYVGIVNLRIDIPLLDECDALLTFMEAALDERLKPLYIVSKSIYYLLKSEFIKAREFLLSHVAHVNDLNTLGRMHYTIAFTLTNDYKYYHKALSYYQKALKYFEQTLNYERVNRCKAMQQVLYVYLHQFNAFKETFEATKKYTHSVKNMALYHFTLVTQAKYHIIKEEYSKALDLLETFEVDLAQYYFYKIFSYFRLNRTLEALNEIKRFKHKEGIIISDLDKEFINLLEYGMTKGYDQLYLTLAKQLLDFAHEQRDVLTIQLASLVYTYVLEKNRMYKEANRVMERFLNVLYNIQ